ncbi:TolC family protein [Planobacterium oryzisoli]|uniref:TolC family protein n=1 Tax=Planobacterium oryzisoli TaxID=2771435 RepID=A0A930YV45_9FLAO|nr:TolC family protein [Planobacterium oryzisoli]MBF5026920.1 TolC family protein [Planobacterium oryzisoli]
MRNIFALFLFLSTLSMHAQEKWSLERAVQYALENNLQVQSSAYNRALQEKSTEIARAERLPGVSANLSNNLSFGQQRYINLVQRNDNFNNSLNVGADMLLYNNGRLEKNYRRALLDLQAASYDVETIKNNIALQIAQEYLSVLLSKEIVQISQSALTNAQQTLQRAEITTRVGTTAQTVLAEAQAALAREEQNTVAAQINVERGLFNLAQLLQLDDYTSFDIEDAPSSLQVEAPLYSAQDILSTAYAQQPQIKAAQMRIESAIAQTEVTKTALYPSVSASAGVGTFYFNQLNRGQDTGFFKQYSENFGQQLGISANIPIFNKGITKLQIEQSKINESLAKNNMEQQKQEVRQNVQRAQFDAKSNYQAYQSAERMVKSAELAEDFALKSYEAGRSTIYELNAARNNTVNARGSLAQAKYNYLFSLKLLNFYAGVPITL